MFEISSKQWETFSAERLQRFEERARVHLERFFPDTISPLSPEQFRAFLHQCVDRSRRLGLESERGIICFAHVALLLGPGVERHRDYPVYHAILNDRDVPADFRAKVAMTMAHDREAARLASKG